MFLPHANGQHTARMFKKFPCMDPGVQVLALNLVPKSLAGTPYRIKDMKKGNRMVYF
jgi:hypothetical protein